MRAQVPLEEVRHHNTHMEAAGVSTLKRVRGKRPPCGAGVSPCACIRTRAARESSGSTLAGSVCKLQAGPDASREHLSV